MLIFRILLGLFGLGIVVFVHELGHFIAARLMGIKVEAFSIGWGKPILKKKIGDVEYRLGAFPIGGYCKMKGQSDHEAPKEGAVHEKGSFFAAHPFRRIVACLGGPLFNLVFAVLVLSVIWGVGFEVNTLSNRIVLVSDIRADAQANPADIAGLQTGDWIVELRGRPTETFNDIQSIIAVHPEEQMAVRVRRNGELLDLSVTPALDRNTGAGRIGIYFWTDPIIERIAEGGAAEIAGLQGGDRILSVNGIELPHTMALTNIIAGRPSVLEVEFERSGEIMAATILPIYTEAGAVNLGIAWQAVRYHNPPLPLHLAIARGASETWRIFTISVRSLSLLFRGIDLTQAVSGPVRITYMVGDVAAQGFAESFIAGISSMASFLALISIALGIMNLLPLPILDGGMIILFLVEAIRRKPPPPRFVAAFQTVGVVLIAGLMFFALFGDILYLTGR